MVSKKTAQKQPNYNGRNNINRWIKKWQLEAANLCQIYSRAIMISNMSNTQGTSIPPGRLLGQWRLKSKLAWPEVPLPPPKSFVEYQKLIVKAFGQGHIIHNPWSEI